MFSEHVFLRTSLDGCFSSLNSRGAEKSEQRKFIKQYTVCVCTYIFDYYADLFFNEINCQVKKCQPQLNIVFHHQYQNAILVSILVLFIHLLKLNLSEVKFLTKYPPIEND